MGAIDSTVVLLALPAITQALHATLYTSIWIILVYLLVLAVATTQLGKLGDIFGRSNMFNLGFAVFTVGSAMCGFSGDVLVLVFSRAVQAVGGALVTSNSGAIVADTFPPERRGHAFGFTGFGYNVGALLGIVIGGVITTFVGWQYIFFINVPIGIVAVGLGVVYIKDKKKIQQKLDIPGMASFGASLVLLTFSMIDFATFGATPFNIALATVGAVLMVLFVLWERASEHPMLNFRIFKSRILKYSISASFFQSLGYMSVVFIVILYLQGIRGLDPFSASVLLIPGYVVGSLSAPYMGRLSDRFGARILATLGISLMCIAILVYLALTATTSYYIVVLATILTGIGGAMFWPANNSTVMAHAPREEYGSTSGFLRTASSVGMLGSFVIAITAASLAVSRSTAFGILLGTSRLIGGVSTSFLHGIDTAFIVSIAILIVAGILSFSRGREDRTKAHVHASIQGKI
ncbi:MAG: MFS transporter [Candidatus Marsarchaeota archaeon]|nr:MFS transporter [Candidatus Marsarchaeota archaeon]